MTSLLTAAMGAAFATALILTPVLRRLALHVGYLDVPNERSSHDRPTPRTGGYAILAGVVAGVAAAGGWRDEAVACIVAGAVALAVIAFVDDQRSLRRLLRLVLQLLVAGLVVVGLSPHGTVAGPAWSPVEMVAWTAAVVWIVGVVNTYNFMDGLNGIAGVAAVVTGAVLAVLALRYGNLPAAVLAAAVAAAAAGFLPFNLAGGTIFMGDSGSTVLGITLGALALLVEGPPGSAPFAAALPLLPFVLDAGATVVRRALRGERFFSTPHRSHYYQRLQQQGWSHAAVTALYGGLTLACGIAALTFDGLTAVSRVAVLAAMIGGHAVIFASIQGRWSRHAGVGRAQ
jgi:UDP-N-acetylmuramyl pentapeptide phosphotransferase/UDP-N-acetylglucosamine-1-phosphate transferase